MNYWTLDIPEPQVIVEYEEDEDGFYWHHRVLLKRIGGPKWVALTPDQDLETIDLNEMHHIVLERNADFPRAQRPYVYCFDDLSRSTLDAHKRRAATQAALLGLRADVEMGQMVWVVGEIDRDDFGDTVDETTLTGSEMNVKGVVLIGGEEVFIERIDAKDKKEWMAKRKGDSADLRQLGDHYDKAGKRKFDLSEAVALLKESPIDDFPLGRRPRLQGAPRRHRPGRHQLDVVSLRVGDPVGRGGRLRGVSHAPSAVGGLSAHALMG
jgi:hypothetical protein